MDFHLQSVDESRCVIHIPPCNLPAELLPVCDIAYVESAILKHYTCIMHGLQDAHKMHLLEIFSSRSPGLLN